MLNTINEYQGLIFDMDGTLIDTMPAHLEAWQATANYFGFPFTKEWLHALGGMPSYKIAAEINREYGMDLDPQAVSRFKMERFAAITHKGDVIKSTFEILNHYYGKKKLAVGTGSQRVNAIPLLESTNILSKLDAVVTATEVINHKPHPDTFLQAAKLLGVPANKCVVFEDTKLGMQAAHAGGMDCILVTNQQLCFYPCVA